MPMVLGWPKLYNSDGRYTADYKPYASIVENKQLALFRSRMNMHMGCMREPIDHISGNTYRMPAWGGDLGASIHQIWQSTALNSQSCYNPCVVIRVA